MRKLINFFTRKMAGLLGTAPLKSISGRMDHLETLVKNVLAEEYLAKNLYGHPRYQSPQHLNRFEGKVYSQNGEDGIIEEIFNRIGTETRYFAEFGVHGIRNNTTLLLAKDWRGTWIEASEAGFKYLEEKFAPFIKDKRLTIARHFISAENIEAIFAGSGVPENLDLLSIDIDGNDFHVWQAIQAYRPRVVCIEYNASMGPSLNWVITYRPGYVWDGTSYFGASLKAMTLLGEKKGYRLVGCDFTGCNAFFVRTDLVGNKFGDDFSPEFHYQPPRYFLERSNGHEPGFGSFTKFE